MQELIVEFVYLCLARPMAQLQKSSLKIKYIAKLVKLIFFLNISKCKR